MIGAPYAEDEIDAYAAYCPEADECLLLPRAEFSERRAIQLRVSPPGNGQLVGVRWARDYAFAATIVRLRGP